MNQQRKIHTAINSKTKKQPKGSTGAKSENQERAVSAMKQDNLSKISIKEKDQSKSKSTTLKSRG